jgi:hypothetical protein
VALRRQPLQPPDLDLFLHQLAGKVAVAGHEHGLRHAQVLDGHQEQPVQLAIALVGKAQRQTDLLADLGRQPLVDDVADMFEVDDIIQDGDGLPPLGLAGIAAQPRQEQLDLLLHAVDALLQHGDLGQRRVVAARECGAGLLQHALDHVADGQRRPAGARQRNGRGFQRVPVQLRQADLRRLLDLGQKPARSAG